MVHRFQDASNTVLPAEKKKMIAALRPFITVQRGRRLPADITDIMGFFLATAHAISKTVVHEVDLTAKNRSVRKISPQTVGSDLRLSILLGNFEQE